MAVPADVGNLAMGTRRVICMVGMMVVGHGGTDVHARGEPHGQHQQEGGQNEY